MFTNATFLKLFYHARQLDNRGLYAESDRITNFLKSASITHGMIRTAAVKSVYEGRNFDNELLYSITSPKGYIIMKERVNMFGDNNPVVIDSAYTLDGEYIGGVDEANLLIVKKGIAPETASPDHNVCSIGFCEKDQKWYGWSHRAMKGFGIGDKAEVCFPEAGYKGEKITNLDEAKQAAIEFAESVS